MVASFDLPVFKGLAGYRASWLSGDISAGLAIAAVGLPSAIAYPAIAGLPPETGIYASIAAPIAYAVFGPSRQLVVGPDAATMTVLAASITAIMAAVPADGAVDRVAVAAALSVGVGVLCLAARLLRLGVLANFLSRPILVGFFAGVSVSILVGQINRFTGISIKSDGLIAPIAELISKIELLHWPTLLLGLSMFVLLQAVRMVRIPIPGPVIVVVLSVILSALFDFKGMGIAVVGDIPSGLPSLTIPKITALPLDLIVLGSAATFLVSFGSGVVAARSFGTRGGQEVDTNGELVGMGAANVAAGLLGAFPISVSDSRTAINFLAGGRSQVASVVSALALIVTLLFLSGALRILPVAALAAILATAAISLIDIRELRNIWRISRVEFVCAMITMWGAISFGVLQGVVVAIAATLIYLLRKIMFPHDALLGRIQGRDGFYKLHRFPDAKPVPGLAICLVQGSLLFFNADYVRTRLRTVANSLPADIRWFVLDANAIAQIDSTGAAALEAVKDDLAKRGITFAIAELHTDARALLGRASVVDNVGPVLVFDDLDDVLRAFRAEGTGYNATTTASRTENQATIRGTSQP
jgi:high affinity sulfate transporter 1